MKRYLVRVIRHRKFPPRPGKPKPRRLWQPVEVFDAIVVASSKRGARLAARDIYGHCPKWSFGRVSEVEATKAAA